MDSPNHLSRLQGEMQDMGTSRRQVYRLAAPLRHRLPGFIFRMYIHGVKRLTRIPQRRGEGQYADVPPVAPFLGRRISEGQTQGPQPSAFHIRP